MNTSPCLDSAYLSQFGSNHIFFTSALVLKVAGNQVHPKLQGFGNLNLIKTLSISLLGCSLNYTSINHILLFSCGVIKYLHMNSQ